MTQYHEHYRRAKADGILAQLSRHAAAHNIELCYVVAIASRESDITNVIGDGGHGIGVMQIDTRSFPIALQMRDDGTWKTDPEALIKVGCNLLAENLAWARQCYPGFSAYKIAAAAYNAGQGNASAGIREAGDCDKFTTPPPYGADVVVRSAIFRQIIEEEGADSGSE